MQIGIRHFKFSNYSSLVIFFFMKTAGRTSILYIYYSQRVLHKFDLEKKCFIVSRRVRIKCIIHKLEKADTGKKWHVLTKKYFSFIPFWKQMGFFIILFLKKISPYWFGHFHFLQGLVLLKAVVKRASPPKVIWKCIKLSSGPTVWKQTRNYT